MGQRIDDEIRQQNLEKKANEATHIKRLLTPESFAEAVEAAGKIEHERIYKEIEEIKEKLSLWLADVNEPIHKQIDNLQERITKLEALVKGHPHDVKEED